MKTNRAARLLVRWLALTHFFEPPVQEIPDGRLGGDAATLFHAQADALTEAFLVIGESPRLSLRRRRALDSPPPPTFVLVTQVVDPVLLEY